MRAFRAVAETKSFKRAGRSLGLGGSAVSKLVAGLEQDVDAQLLQRTTRTLTLSEAGSSFYESVVRILDEADAAIERVRDHRGQPRGHLRVSLPNSFGLRWMSQRLPDFLVRYPGLSLNVSFNDRYVDVVAEGYDCALRIGSELANSALYARRLGSVPRMLVAAPAYLKHAPRLQVPEDLLEHDALLYSLASTGTAWPFVVDGKPISIPVQGRLRVDSSLALRDALLAGIGLTLTPHFVIQDLVADGRLVALLTDFMPPAHGVFGVTSDNRHAPGKVRAFLDFVEQQLQACGYGRR